MFASTFTPDQTRSAEFLACLWQGPVPESLELIKWIYLHHEPRQMLLLWDGDGDAYEYIEHAFGGFGTIHTEPITDATPGLAAAFARDLHAFGRHLEETGSSPAAIHSGLDVRRRGLEAATQEDAAAAGRAWAAEQAAERAAEEAAEQGDS